MSCWLATRLVFELMALLVGWLQVRLVGHSVLGRSLGCSLAFPEKLKKKEKKIFRSKIGFLRGLFSN